jgi:hypothetical protein
MPNRSDIFKAAWKSYRLARPAIFAAGDENGRRVFLPTLFGKMLRRAWDDARAEQLFHRVEPITAKVVMEAVNLSEAAKATRLAEIDADLRAQDYSDAPTNWGHRLSLQAERAKLAA